MGDRSIYVLALSYLGIWLFFPLLIYIPWVFFTRQTLGVLLLVIPVSLLLWFYGTSFWPKDRQLAKSQHGMTILSFNMQRSNADVNAFIMLLRSHPSDLLALQEISDSSEELLNDALLKEYPYHVYYRANGLAVYSQYSISDYKVHSAQPWPFQSLIINAGNNPLQLINAHLARIGIILFFRHRDLDVIRKFAMDRADQINRIKMAVGEIGIPAIVACDGNMTNLTNTYSQMTANLRDAYRERGWGLGHTFLIPRGFEIKSKVNLPFQRIDYIFHTKDLCITNVKVISTDTGSDHRPIWAQFELPP
jgi:endonuclease/exonuclease/phosphatase family metal-dependent hydrolase